MTKQEFLNAVAILNAAKLTADVVVKNKGKADVCVTFTCNYDDCENCERSYDNEFDDDYVGEDENDVVENEDADEDFEMLYQLLDDSDAETWKEFVYEIIDEEYTYIPSWKIAEFVNEEFGTVVSAGTVAACKASAARR
jgi:hypothetical protein